MADSTALFIKACSSGKAEAVGRMLVAGLSTDMRDENGLTGLIWAGRKGRVAVAEILLAADADVEGKDRRGRTALFHAVTSRQHAFVQQLALAGANVSPVDLHDWTPLDFARRNSDPKMVALLEQLGAMGKQVWEPAAASEEAGNSFWFGAYASGGLNYSEGAREREIQLGTAMKKWKGDYTKAVKEFTFRLALDGSGQSFTNMWGVRGPKEATRYRDRVEVKIAVPEDWWHPDPDAYKGHLTNAVEDGFHSMIALLQRNRHTVDREALLVDWENVKKEYLAAPAAAIPGAETRAAHAARVQEILREYEERKRVAASA